jgi:hypothetical protein
MLDDFIMNFCYEELEDYYYTIEDLEKDYLEKENYNGTNYTGLYV